MDFKTSLLDKFVNGFDYVKNSPTWGDGFIEEDATPPTNGEAGDVGAPAGDLLVTVSVASHPVFERSGNDVYMRMPISFVQAALGAELSIPTLDGNVKFNIQPGTQTSSKFRLQGKGIPNLRNNKYRGDQYVEVYIVVPKNLTEKQKEILKEFEPEIGAQAEESKKGWGHFFKKNK